ncbi:MAG: CHASE2 domain-containing protein [Chitinophagales bacterium]
MNRKHFLNKDIIFSTIFVFLCVWALKYSIVNLHALDPIEKALSDFDYGDLVYKHRKENAKPDANGKVVIVEIGRNRAEIAREIEIINAHHPAVLAIDAWFAAPGQAETDSLLFNALKQSPKLILGSYLFEKEGTEELGMQHSFTAVDALGHSAYLNFVGEYEKTIRYFKPKEVVDGKEVNSFAAEIVKQYAPERFEQLKERDKELEFINYTKTTEQFVPNILIDEVQPNNTALDALQGKIVILGKTNNNDLEDLHFTPFNDQLAGRSKPDMSGVFIHANAVEMILADNYVNKVPAWVVFLFAVLLTYITIVFHIFYFVEKHIWYHLFAKLLQLVFLIVLVFVKVQLLAGPQWVFDENIIAMPVILSVDLLYFYDAIVKWLNKRFGYKSYFLQHGKH